MEILTLGKKIKKLRIKNRLKLKDLADGIFSVSKLSFVENDKVIPTSKELKLIAKKLNEDVSYFTKTIKEQLVDEFNNLLNESYSKENLKELIKKANENGEVDLSYTFLTEYTARLILSNSFDEVLEMIPMLFRNVINNYSEEKMAEYIFTVSNFLTNTGEEKTAIRFLKVIEDIEKAQGKEKNLLRNKLFFNLCLLKCHIAIADVDEAKKYATRVKEGIATATDKSLVGEAVFLLRAFSLINPDEKMEYVEEDATEGLINYPVRMSYNYILLSDISFSLGNKKEGIRYLNRAESVFEKSNVYEYLKLLKTIIHKFVSRSLYQESERIIDIYVDKAINSGTVSHVESSYYYKALILYKRGDYEMAELFLNVSLDVLLKTQDKKLINARYNDLGNFYYSIGNYRASVEAFSKAKNLIEDKTLELNKGTMIHCLGEA